MNDNRKIAVNSVIIFIRLIIVSLVSVLVSRYVLDALGASDYGLYNVVGGIVALLTVINGAMAGATYRYIAVELGKGEKGQLRKYFNISQSIHVAIAGIILILGLTVGEWYVHTGLNVEPDRFTDALIVYHITIFTTVVSTLFVPYKGLLVAYEKFAYTASVEVVANLLKLTAVMTILYDVPNKLICYSVIMSSVVVLDNLSLIFYSWKKYRNVVKPAIFRDKEAYKDLLSFTGWNAMGAFTNVAGTQITSMLINYFFSTIANAAFAIANQINNFIIMFANTLNQASVPQITKSLSGGNEQRSFNLTARVGKYTFFMMILIAFPVLMELDFLLGLWLKDVPKGANIYCILIVIAGTLKCICQSTSSLVTATGKIKVFQIVGVFYNLLPLLVGGIFFYLGSDAYALSAIICVFNFFNIPLNVFLLKKVIDFDVKSFANLAYKRMAYVAIPLIIVYLLYNPNEFGTIGHLVGFVSSFIFVAITIFILGLDKKEKSIVASRIQKIKSIR